MHLDGRNSSAGFERTWLIKSSVLAGKKKGGPKAALSHFKSDYAKSEASSVPVTPVTLIAKSVAASNVAWFAPVSAIR